MKKNISILIVMIIISISGFNSMKVSQKYDYSTNQLGGYLIYKGITGESDAFSDIGGLVAAGGGGALVNSAGLATGAAWALGSNPVGWAIAGVTLGF
ncbi:hypothetical protein NXX36_20245 [Bacteroides fragilis]|uniref:Uncharacterized protein n=1 Tax=Bacteroides fragilis TaxID=817 RepID=A0AAP8ZVC9_BACFG|nr:MULTISPECIES: hypothetical protein [Bacteroides]MBV4152518.1 hypothetical protein [Bacteroides fragilis]MCE8578103.1 hypothetical protein [Bacteroides fragilis]MCE8650761.1 hypothetical protein [Bacteroides fragilis]MCM0348481.1 hypothetical protein [Bacteroides fragilis]MCM0368692.1 hypothetical protein [Bacteroides fragilis]